MLEQSNGPNVPSSKANQERARISYLQILDLRAPGKCEADDNFGRGGNGVKTTVHNTSG